MAWGSVTERYTHICMSLLVARYQYYVLADTRMSDAEYDALEDTLRRIEAARPELTHPKSPTQVPGSDNPNDYPSSVRSWCERLAAGEVEVDNG
jgi:NAD-dependent DNA ligase